LLPIPAFFFKVLPLPQKFSRFYCFQLPLPLPASCFMKNASASGSSKNHANASEFAPLPTFFFKVLLLPQNLTASTASASSFRILINSKLMLNIRIL